MDIDTIHLNFNPYSLIALNVVLAFIMFGVALDLKLKDFYSVWKQPKAPIIGVIAQFILLPFSTWILVQIIQPAPSIALGMILVAACPGGNISNFITHLSKGNTALSVSMTGISTALATVMTPLNIAFWGSLTPGTDKILKEIQLDTFSMVITVFLILGIPLALGLFFSHKLPQLTQKIKKSFKYASIIFFIVFIGLALTANFENFRKYIHLVFFAVFVQNSVAFAVGYFSSKIFRLTEYDSRAVAIEVGIQNSGLGLTLIFDFFGGLGGMALVAAWWGVWHIISGLTLAKIFNKRPIE
ncbi:bile acid:sodium symporter family protein [Leptospira stimsonii]|uniref:Symporter n=1 Tax=Leptospira stimsonii TaxID=2202203 RepID=A0A396YTJ7_9LEPT|nr:bile acid:sodium symporter family protein [Leptospira stimsonii]RHX84646.1 symporter [Leptospira stimsonii]